MDFMKSYSSVLSSKDPSSNASQKPKKSSPVAKPDLPRAKDQDTLKASALQIPNSGQTQSIQQSAVPQQEPGKTATFQALLDESIHQFKKGVLFAMEHGIQEQLMTEKQALLTQVQTLSERNQLLEAENVRLKQQNDTLQVSSSTDQYTKLKMAELIGDLKQYRIDSLYAHRALKEWAMVARHGRRSAIYTAMMDERRGLRAMREAFSTMHVIALQKQRQNTIDSTSQQISDLTTKRDEFFLVERTKYDKEIKQLKSELQQFAVKERKMKDAMKSAFLKGINAISEEASFALDRAGKIGMPQKLQQELEQNYVAQGGNVDDVQVGSDDEDVLNQDYQDDQIVVQEEIVRQRGPSEVQNQVVGTSPARVIRQHSIQDEKLDPRVPKPEPQPQRMVPQLGKNPPVPQKNTLANTLKCSMKVKHDRTSMLYMDGAKLKVEVTKE